MAEFMKKMKSNIDKGLASVSVTSATLLEMTKINGLVTVLKENKQVLISELGALTYENHLNPHVLNEEKMNNVILQIVELDEKIRDKEEQISKLKEEKESITVQNLNSQDQACECGTKLLSDAVFCMGCGKKVGMLCTCGASVKPGSKFCGKCGTKLVE